MGGCVGQHHGGFVDGWIWFVLRSFLKSQSWVCILVIESKKKDAKKGKIF